MMIPRLEDLSLTTRIVITFCIVVFCLFLLTVVGYLTGGWDQAQSQTKQIRFTVPEQWREELFALDKRALDEAYVKQIELLYRTWVADAPTLSHDPGRITVGLSNNRQAWVLAREQLETKKK